MDIALSREGQRGESGIVKYLGGSEMTTCRSGIVGKEVEYVTWASVIEAFES